MISIIGYWVAALIIAAILFWFTIGNKLFTSSRKVNYTKVRQ